MKLHIAGIVASVSLFCAPMVAADTCGPFGMFQGNDYCVSCPSGFSKVHNCPGGEAGRVIVGTQHQGCQISYYDSASCGGAAMLQGANASKEPAKPAKANDVPAHASKGRAVVSREGDEIIIRMTPQDFDKLMTLKGK